jgi:hypothetical protein
LDVNEREKHKLEKHHERDHERHRERDREGSGDDPRRHASIIARRWLGSPPPTQERYARALQQWQALPGAVVRPATDVTTAETPPATSPVPAGPAEQERES